MPYNSPDPRPSIHSDTSIFDGRLIRTQNKRKTCIKYEFEEQIDKSPNDLLLSSSDDSDDENYNFDPNSVEPPLTVLYQKSRNTTQNQTRSTTAFSKHNLINETSKINASNQTQKKIDNSSSAKSLYSFIQYSGIAFVAFFVFVLYGVMINANKTSAIERKNCSFKSLQMKFSHQDPLIWNYLKFGVEDLLNNEATEPKVYLFLHDNNIKSRIIINEIAQTSSSCFDPALTPVRLERNDFLTDDYGLAIEKYKNNINDGGVLIVVNLNEIPPKNARALHAICDTYTPIARRVLILLTLAVDNLNCKLNPINIAQNKLTDMWSSTLKSNELNPLITRVTDNVFRLNSE